MLFSTGAFLPCAVHDEGGGVSQHQRWIFLFWCLTVGRPPDRPPGPPAPQVHGRQRELPAGAGGPDPRRGPGGPPAARLLPGLGARPPHAARPGPARRRLPMSGWRGFSSAGTRPVLGLF